MKKIISSILILSLLSCEIKEGRHSFSYKNVLSSKIVEDDIENLILDWRYGRFIDMHDTLSFELVLYFTNLNSNAQNLIQEDKSYFYHVSTLRLSNRVLMPVISEVAAKYKFRLYGLIYDELDKEIKSRILLAEYTPYVKHIYSTIEGDILNTFYMTNDHICDPSDTVQISAFKATFQLGNNGIKFIEKTSIIHDTLSMFPHESNWFQLLVK